MAFGGSVKWSVLRLSRVSILRNDFFFPAKQRDLTRTLRARSWQPETIIFRHRCPSPAKTIPPKIGQGTQKLGTVNGISSDGDAPTNRVVGWDVRPESNLKLVFALLKKSAKFGFDHLSAVDAIVFILLPLTRFPDRFSVSTDIRLVNKSNHSGSPTLVVLIQPQKTNIHTYIKQQ